MALRQYYLGSVGPLLYDDAAFSGVNVDGTVVADNFNGVVTGTAIPLLSGIVDPSAGAGVAAPVASLYGRDNIGVGELWFKVGTNDTDWVKLA